MISYLIVAAFAQASAGQAFAPLCPGQGPCAVVQPSAETAADVAARKEQQMTLEAQVYGPLASGRNASSCAAAAKRANDGKHPGMAAIVQALCRT